MQEALCETSVNHTYMGVCRDIEDTAEVIAKGSSGLLTYSGVVAQAVPHHTLLLGNWLPK